MKRELKIGVTADVIIDYGIERGIVYVERGNEPFKGHFALPGGFYEPGESIEQTALREAREETNLELRLSNMKLLGVYSKPGRDPRGPVVTVVYYVKLTGQEPRAGDDAADVKILKNKPNKLAFDHSQIIDDYMKIRSK